MKKLILSGALLLGVTALTGCLPPERNYIYDGKDQRETRLEDKLADQIENKLEEENDEEIDVQVMITEEYED